MRAKASESLNRRDMGYSKEWDQMSEALWAMLATHNDSEKIVV